MQANNDRRPQDCRHSKGSLLCYKDGERQGFCNLVFSRYHDCPGYSPAEGTVCN